MKQDDSLSKMHLIGLLLIRVVALGLLLATVFGLGLARDIATEIAGDLERFLAKQQAGGTKRDVE